jgi:MFS family permease
MSYRAGGVLVAGFFTVAAAYAIRYGYGMILPAMLPALKITKAQAGIIYGSYFTAYTLFSPVLGLISDKGNAKTILTIFTGLLAAGTLCMGYVGNVISACLFFALAGFGHSACWTPVVALVQNWVPDHRRGAALAFTTLGSGVGVTTWSLLLPLIIGTWNWQAAWISMGLFGFGVAFLNFLLIKNPPAAITKKYAVAEDGKTVLPYLVLIRQSRLWFIGLSYLLVGFTVLVPFTFLSTYATDHLGHDYALATSLITVVAVSGMAGKVTLGILSDTLGRIRVMSLCCLLMAAGCAGMALFEGPAILFGAALLFGVGYGAVWPVYAAAAPDFFVKQSAGSVIGLWTLFLGVGSIISPVLCGWTIDYSGSYTWTFVLGIVGGVLAALLLVPVSAGAKTINQSRRRQQSV